jgi:uncharacterized protein (TIGR03437 family)
MPISGTLYLKMGAPLEGFLQELQTPSSPQYHRWLTPEQFGGRFGVSQSDLEKIVHWMEGAGMKVNGVARGANRVTFSGAAGTVGRALRTSFRRYTVDGKLHFANSTRPQIPAAMEPVTAGFGGLDDFKLEPLIAVSPIQPAGFAPDYNLSGTHFIAPGDFATIYNVNPLYAAGIDGTGQKVAIVGASAIDLSDIRTFRKIFGLAANDPQVIVVGNDPGKNSTQIEADLDLEWSGAVAPGANIIYVYAGDVESALEYAVDQNVAPVISMSFGGCEQYNSPVLQGLAQQANAQGITVFAASGDAGATNCDRSALIAQATRGLTVSFPASIPEITAVGGTSFDDSDGAFWAARNNSSLSSALTYIPERAWNDSRTFFASTGGGVSVYYPKPWWQAGPGVPNDGMRDLPDISLAASPSKYAYLIVMGGNLAAVGGTSASSPSFAGITALLNQHLSANGGQAGLGNINPALYALAQKTTDVFHDIVDGDNAEPCAQGSPACVNGLAGYTAGAGYDLATGLGTVDANNLVMEWVSGAASSTTLLASPSTAGVNDMVNLTATVTSVGGGPAPSGSVYFLVNGFVLGSAQLSGSGATATATISITGAALAAGNGGSATVSALYGGGNLSGSAGSANVTVQPPASAGSYVAPFVTPNPAPEVLGSWEVNVSLTEIAGVGTTLTRFTINGASQSLNSFDSTKIPAHGSTTATVFLATNPAPSQTFGFAGTDDNGRTWTQQITVPFTPGSTPPVFGPAITLVNRAGSQVAHDAQADPSCQWFIPLSVRETGGYYMQLTSLRANTADMSAQIQRTFGTARLAPYQTLEGNLCFSAAGTQPVGVTLTAAVEDGSYAGPKTASLPVPASFPAAGTSATPMTVSPASAGLAPSNSSASIAVSFGSGAPAWTASISQGNSLANWLAISQASGTGAGTITLNASAAGLSPGGYNATVWINAPGATPPLIGVPVTFVVGGSDSVSIAGLQNAFSFQSVFAPGMSLTVYGTNLAAGTQKASRLPFPLTMQGVSATVNGVAAPISYASAGQLNIQVPYETAAGPALLSVNRGGQIATYPFMVSTTAPGVLANVFENSTGQPVTSAPAGDVLLLFMTGDGDVTPFLTTGATPSSSTNTALLPKPRLPVTVTVGGVAAQVLFAGVPSGLAGVTQIDFVAPANVPAGEQDVVVTVGGVAAPAVKLTVTAPTTQ